MKANFSTLKKNYGGGSFSGRTALGFTKRN